MVDVATYLLYAQFAQQNDAFVNANNVAFKGGTTVDRYVRLLYIVRSAVQNRFNIAPTDPTLDATANYMLSLSGITTITPAIPSTPFIIIIQPQSQTVTSGTNVTFTVAVSGGVSPYTYQWYKDGVLVVGVTTPSLTLIPAMVGSAGAYNCIITDAVGDTLTSNAANLVVNSATVAVFAVPLSSDPFPLVSDTFSYTYTQNVNPTDNIGWNLSDADNNVNWWIFKEPIGNTPKLSYDNGTNLPFADVIPSSVMRAPVILGGFRYYLTRIQLAYDATQPVTLKTTP